MDPENLKKEFLPKYLSDGKDKFYKFLLLYSLNKLILLDKGEYKGTLPNLELLNYAEQFIILYRREGEDVYLQMSALCRKVAHKVYRIMLKKDMTTFNNKFLNLV